MGEARWKVGLTRSSILDMLSLRVSLDPQVEIWESGNQGIDTD